MKKNRKNHVKELNEKLFTETDFKQVKIIIYLEDTLDVHDIKDAIWRFANNVDARRDTYFIKASAGGDVSVQKFIKIL